MTDRLDGDAGIVRPTPADQIDRTRHIVAVMRDHATAERAR